MEGTIRIAGTVGESIVDGPGFRYTVFTQGCPHHCPGCHNPETHPFEGGEARTAQELLQKLDKNPLLSGVTLRIRAEHAVTRGRAAIIKAYYLKNPHSDVPKEVLTVSLNPDSSNLPYNLGRLFSVLEAIQSAANPGINSTIKDKYFNSASATPAIVFPVLLNLAQKHLKKLDTGLRTYYDKQLTALLSKLGEGYPQRLNLPQQGSFQLGYYHQTQVRFEKKEEK